MNLRPYKTIKHLRAAIEAAHRVVTATLESNTTALQLVEQLQQLNAMKDARIAQLERQLAIAEISSTPVVSAKFLN